jgi:hypothetical protein
MGTTSKNYRGTKESFGEKELRDFLYEEYVSQGIEFSMIHFEKQKDTRLNINGLWHEVYAICRNNKNNRKPFIVVILIDIGDNEIYWKDITEDMGPCYYNCPTSFFKFVPITYETSYAVNWRKECENNDTKINRIIL